MKRQEKELIKLCFKYNQNCKLCPRNRKCEEELEKEQSKKKK